jgi:hypothetical protein
MEFRASLAVKSKNPDHVYPETLEIVSKWPSALYSSNGISPHKSLKCLDWSKVAVGGAADFHATKRKPRSRPVGLVR